MNPADCRELVERLMSEESRTLGELETLLKREHQILLENRQVEALEDACAARQICMGTLLRIQEERRGVLRTLGYAQDAAGLEELLDDCDPQRALRGHWARVAAAAARCRELNDRNGALVQSRIRRVEGMLGILTGQAPDPRLYGRTGALPVGSGARLVATEA